MAAAHAACAGGRYTLRRAAQTSMQGDTMPIPQVTDRIKEAPAVVLRAVFAGIGQLLMAVDKVRAQVKEQIGSAPPTGPAPEAKRQPEQTGNVTVLRDRRHPPGQRRRPRRPGRCGSPKARPCIPSGPAPVRRARGRPPPRRHPRPPPSQPHQPPPSQPPPRQPRRPSRPPRLRPSRPQPPSHPRRQLPPPGGRGPPPRSQRQPPPVPRPPPSRPRPSASPRQASRRQASSRQASSC